MIYRCSKVVGLDLSYKWPCVCCEVYYSGAYSVFLDKIFTVGR